MVLDVNLPYFNHGLQSHIFNHTVIAMPFDIIARNNLNLVYIIIWVFGWFCTVHLTTLTFQQKSNLCSLQQKMETTVFLVFNKRKLITELFQSLETSWMFLTSVNLVKNIQHLICFFFKKTLWCIHKMWTHLYIKVNWLASNMWGKP